MAGAEAETSSLRAKRCVHRCTSRHAPLDTAISPRKAANRRRPAARARRHGPRLSDDRSYTRARRSARARLGDMSSRWDDREPARELDRAAILARDLAGSQATDRL